MAGPLLWRVTAEASAVTAWAFDIACVLQFANLVPEPHAASQCRCEEVLWAVVGCGGLWWAVGCGALPFWLGAQQTPSALPAERPGIQVGTQRLCVI